LIKGGIFIDKGHLERLTDAQLAKSVRSHEKSLAEHIDKINNPLKYVPDYGDWNIMKQEGMREYWEKEIVNMQKQICITRLELKRRQENE
jgi:hypothetical protein